MVNGPVNPGTMHNCYHQSMHARTLHRPATSGLALLMISCLWSNAQAQVVVERAWARATVQNQTSTGAFMRLTAQKDVLLTGAASPVAGVVEVHEMKMDDNFMRMRRAGDLQLKAGQPIELTSGGFHIMMMFLKKQIKAGEVVPLTLEETNGRPKVPHPLGGRTTYVVGLGALSSSRQWTGAFLKSRSWSPPA